MPKRPLDRNLKVKLSLLEAKTGKDASIAWCNTAVRNSRFARKVSILADDVDHEQEILKLQRQTVESKLHHFRTKILSKNMKNIKASAVTKCMRKLKESRKTEESSVADLEAELETIKKLDHLKLASWAFHFWVLKDQYLASKFDHLQMKEKLEAEKAALAIENVSLFSRLASSKSFQDSVKASRTDLIQFMKKLFHENLNVEVESRKNPPVPKAVQKTVTKTVMNISTTESLEPLKSNESFFVDTLYNSDAEENSSNERNTSQHELVFTDEEGEGSDGIRYDLSDDSEGSEDDDKKPKRSKNRLGQLARRRLAERQFGRDARHLQEGGMSVRQREEMRLVRSQKRNEMWEMKKTRAASLGKTGATASSSKVGGNQNSLHPSWAAKQQARDRASQAQFLGKKTKFDEPAEPAKQQPVLQKIDPDLHPSWAAKLHAKNKDVGFQGTRVKFDD